jgi:aerobic carbon-monoxide dehydrogenase large subunit
MIAQQGDGVDLPTGRTEDQRLLTGHGRFVADLQLPNQLFACVLRSPYAHARIGRIDTALAIKAAGVQAIFVASDLAAAGLADMPQTKMWMPPGPPVPSRPILAKDTVRFVGESVALVVANTLCEAQDAAELIDVEYEALSPLINMRDAVEYCFDWQEGDRDAVDRAFANAAHIVAMETVINRVAISPLEPRAAIGVFESVRGYRLHVQSQGVHHIRNVLADTVFGIPRDRLQVLTDDVGGAFGMKVSAFPEYALVLFAANKLGHPVKWVSDRAEAFLSDTHGRDQIIDAELAFDSTQRIVGLRASKLAAMGAYVTGDGPEMSTNQFIKVFGHTYLVPALHVRVRGVTTNTTPIAAYRGYGKPEAISIVERLIERAASEMGVDRIDLRRRNLVTATAMPYTNASGKTYDCGDFEKIMDAALQQADWDGFAERRSEATARGKKRGIGVGLALQMTMGIPKEISEVALSPDGAVIVRTGMQTCGQGHETTYAQLVSDCLGVPFDVVRVEQGNSDHLPDGVGTGASTGLTVGGSTIFTTAETVIEQCKPYAADHLEAALDDIVFEAGRFTVAGTDRHVGLFELARSLATNGANHGPQDGVNPTVARLQMDSNLETTPNGAYVAEVEVDPATGMTTLIAFTAVNDLGRVINPAIADGQIHGGIVQGLGQTMVEDVVYDAASGQLLTGSFMDYCLPRADDVPTLVVSREGVTTTNNPLGAKGAGEIGAIGALAPVLNAVADAIGSDRFDMPTVSERIWRVLDALGDQD